MGIKLQGSVIAAVALVALVGCASTSGKGGDAQRNGATDCTLLSKPVDLKVGQSSVVPLATARQAEDAGLFQQEKLNVSIQTVNSGQDAISLLGTGKLDAALVAGSVDLFNAIDAKIDVKFVAGEGVQNKADPVQGFFVRSDLLDSGKVKSIADLKGKTVAFTGNKGGNGAFIAQQMLQQSGLTVKDVRTVTLAYANMEAAFANRSIDAALVGDFFSPVIAASGKARRLGDQNALVQNQWLGILYGPNLLTHNRQAGCAFLRANMLAAKERLAPGYSKRAAAVKTFIAAGVPAATLQSVPEYIYPPTLPISSAPLGKMQTFYASVGVLNYKEPVPDTTVLDTRMHDAAVASLPK